MIQFNKETCGNLDAALRREWLETNGLGGFASSTITGLNTRRYHGLLVAATKPPVGREVLLSKLEETLLIDGRPFELSANRYPGVVHPQGFRYLTQFRLDPFPIFTYEVEGIVIEKTVFMVYGENSTVVQYEVKSEFSATAKELASGDPATDRISRLPQYNPRKQCFEPEHRGGTGAGSRGPVSGAAHPVPGAQRGGITKDGRLVQKF